MIAQQIDIITFIQQFYVALDNRYKTIDQLVQRSNLMKNLNTQENIKVYVQSTINIFNEFITTLENKQTKVPEVEKEKYNDFS